MKPHSHFDFGLIFVLVIPGSKLVGNPAFKALVSEIDTTYTTKMAHNLSDDDYLKQLSKSKSIILTFKSFSNQAYLK